MDVVTLLALILLFIAFAFLGILYPFPPFYKRRWALLSLFLSAALFVVVSKIEAANGEDMELEVSSSRLENQPTHWVAVERLNRRTCPSTACGVVGQFFFREGTQVFEERDGWARVTKKYTASCKNGISEFVDSGNDSCSPENGVVDGEFSEWVSSQFLVESRPADPSEGAAGDEALVSGSDDFARYRSEFTEAAKRLIRENRCTKDDFRTHGGWVKSTTHRSDPVYFVYCGGLRTSNRLYFNASTGKVFR